MNELNEIFAKATEVLDVDYDRDNNIDETALDIEWLRQAEIARKYGKYYTFVNKHVKKLREKKKIVRSELILEANKFPKECCHKDKPNVADIEAYYRSHENYKQVVDQLIEVEHELENAEIAKNEMAFTRKATLENLVVLHGNMYFAGPRVPRDIRKERTEFMERIKKALNKDK